MDIEPWLNNYCAKAIAGQTRLMFDIGASSGEWTTWGCEHFDHIVSVDCDTRSLWNLNKKFGKCAKVSVVDAAVSSQSESVKVYSRTLMYQTSILPEHPIGGNNQAESAVQEVREIDGITIDDLILKYGKPDFVKMDVEGAEAIVLSGAVSAAAKQTKWLIEIHDTEKEVKNQLTRLGWDAVNVLKHPLPGAHPGHGWIYLEP